MDGSNGQGFPLFVISNPRFAERYAYVLAHVATRSAQKPLVVGVVGSEVLAAAPDAGHSTRFYPGVVGCALSHVAAYRQMVDLGLERAIVVEDDVVLPRGFDDLARTVLAELREGEVISFYSPTMIQQRFSSVGAVALGGSRLVTPMEPRGLRTALCYAIHVAAARRIAATNDPVVFAADAFGEMYERGLVKHLRLLSPSPVTIAAFKSTIGYLRQASLRHRLSEAVNAVPLLAPLLKARRRWLRDRRARNQILVDEPSPISGGNPNYVP